MATGKGERVQRELKANLDPAASMENIRWNPQQVCTPSQLEYIHVSTIFLACLIFLEQAWRLLCDLQ